VGFYELRIYKIKKTKHKELTLRKSGESQRATEFFSV